jgi:hypothetical protein
MIDDWQLPNADFRWQLLIELMSKPFLLRDAQADDERTSFSEKPSGNWQSEIGN